MDRYQVNLKLEKPPGLTENHAATFQDKTVVESYAFRPPYSEELIPLLIGLIPEKPRLLDIGCGCGDLTLILTKLGGSVDAVDFSANMIAHAKERDPSQLVNWLVGKIEDQDFLGQYDLIAAAESLHWMDWNILFPKLKRHLKAEGFLAIVERNYQNLDWWSSELTETIKRWSTNREFSPYQIVPEIVDRGFFEVVGWRKMPPQAFSQSIDDLITAFHSRNGLSRERMLDGGQLFDSEMRQLLESFADGEFIDLGSYTEITWGKII